VNVLGFGPFLELDAGIYTKRPESTPHSTRRDANGDAAVHVQFLTGLRLTLDLPGK
jgi:hypothetical protein